MSKELARNICNLLVLHVVSDGVSVVHWFDVSKFHVVHTNTIVCQCFSMNITDSSANLQELLILLDGILELT